MRVTSGPQTYQRVPSVSLTTAIGSPALVFAHCTTSSLIVAWALSVAATVGAAVGAVVGAAVAVAVAVALTRDGKEALTLAPTDALAAVAVGPRRTLVPPHLVPMSRHGAHGAMLVATTWARDALANGGH